MSVRLHKVLNLWWWKLQQRTRQNRCSQLRTQPSCPRCATRHSWLASLSGRGLLAPALWISRIGKRKQPSRHCSNGQVLYLDHASQQKTAHLVTTKRVWTRTPHSSNSSSLWHNPLHVQMSSYDFKEILVLFSQFLCWTSPLTAHSCQSSV